MDLLVVMNPSSRDFEAERRWPAMRERLSASAGALEVINTTPDEADTRALLAGALRRGADRVVAIGGDGTMHLVVSEIMASAPEPRPELAVIPFGTANDVAKSIGLPIDDEAALVEIALAPEVGRIDVARIEAEREGKVRQTHWIDSVTLGMDADVLDARGQYRDLGGYAAYLAALAERSIQQQSLDVRVYVDGEPTDARVFNIIVNNVPIYAGELSMPGSRLDDGLLDVYLFNRREYVSKLLSFAIKQMDVLQLGMHELLEDLTDNQRTLRGREVKIRLASPRMVQVDGEVFGEADELRCAIAGSLRIARPRSG